VIEIQQLGVYSQVSNAVTTDARAWGFTGKRLGQTKL